MRVGAQVQPLECYLPSVEMVVKYNSTVNSQLTVIIPSFRTHRSEEQFDRVYTVYLLFILKKIASYTIKTGFFFCFLEMLRKMDFTIKSRYGQVVLNKPLFLAYGIPMVSPPSVVVHTFKLEYMYL